MSELLAKILEELSHKDTSGYQGAAKFVIEGHGAIILDADGVRASDDPADVTLTATFDVFRGLFEGRLKPTTAYMTGKIKLDGSMGHAMALAPILS